LEVETWDGRILRVSAIEIAQDQDLGLVRVDADLPAVVKSGPEPRPGDAVSAVGYPEGGPFQRLTGSVVDYVDGSVFGEAARIMRVTIPLRPGNSGGAVLNEQGELVGIAFAGEIASGHGLVIPAASLFSAINRAEFVPASGGC
jgi:S1-C subfamily serine protease